MKQQIQKQNDLMMAAMPMMKSVLELFMPAMGNSSPPADKNLKEQIDLVAESLYDLPSIREPLKGFLNKKQFVGLFYELEQKDLDELYDIMHQAEQLKE